jgi:5-methyltetrahydropteroyltriglutamate--homocysteine methyltransferase
MRRLLPGRAAAQVHRSDGDARRGAERGPGRHPARAGALPRLLGHRDSPHVNDVPAPDVLPVCYQVKAGAPFANPRHSHEVDAFRTQKLPERMTLICGVVETTHNYVEHPQVIAERLERAVRAVGDRERVMAGTDCGFGTIVGDTQVSEDVVWAKLEAMRDGAAIASQRLWR